MREYTIYIADDETEFSTKEECIEYEAKRTAQFSCLQEHVCAYDIEGQRICFTDKNDFLKKYERMFYLVIDNDFPEENVAFICAAGYNTIPNTRGIYRYENYKSQWVSFNKVWAPFIDIIKEWY